MPPSPLTKPHPYSPVDQNSTRRPGRMGASTIFQHALCVYDPVTGRIVPGHEAVGLRVAGISPQTYYTADNPVDTRITVKFQDPLLHISADDAFDATHEGHDVYIVDDHTVAKTDGTGTRSKAGKLLEVRDGLALVKLIE